MTIADWRKNKIDERRKEQYNIVSNINTTIVIYFFRNEEEADKSFEAIEFSILQTWHCCGLLPVTIVTNKPCKKMLEFVEERKEFVTIKISPRLIPGSIISMSRDMDGWLTDYFETENVLVVQNDGMPLCGGLEKFIGKYDYIGAPFPPGRDDWITRVLLKQNTLVGNGGFSLRSRRLCEYGCKLYQKKYRFIPNCYLLYEDLYYCRFLPTYEKKYREMMKFPSTKEATQFSFEDDLELLKSYGEIPFGFHSNRAFEKLQNIFGEKMERLLK